MEREIQSYLRFSCIKEMGYLGIIYNNDVRVRPACPQEERGHGRRAEHLAIRQCSCQVGPLKVGIWSG